MENPTSTPAIGVTPRPSTPISSRPGWLLISTRNRPPGVAMNRSTSRTWPVLAVNVNVCQARYGSASGGIWSLMCRRASSSHGKSDFHPCHRCDAPLINTHLFVSPDAERNPPRIAGVPHPSTESLNVRPGSPSRRTCAWKIAAISAGHGSKVPTRPVAPGTTLTCATPVKWRPRTCVISDSLFAKRACRFVGCLFRVFGLLRDAQVTQPRRVTTVLASPPARAYRTLM